MFLLSLISDYFQKCINVFIFLPYFFSVDVMVKTLFAPWKRIAPKTKRVGFSFSDWATDVGFDLVSRWIGSVMRGSVLLAYLMIVVLYLPTIAILTIIHLFCVWPLQWALAQIMTPPEVVEIRRKKAFVFSHTLDAVNEPQVSAWYDRIATTLAIKKRWWDLKNLMAHPPLARDWAQGYTPTLDEYSVDLSTDASHHESRPMTIGRQRELLEMEDILCKSRDANIIMTGAPGVGKTTVIESLAYRIYIGKGHPLLSFKRLVELNLERILSQHTDMKVREEILSTLLDEAHRAGNIIIVINNIDRYVSTDIGRIDLTIPLEKYLAQPEVQVIGVTTPTAYERYIRTRPNLSHHFTPVQIDEISPETALEILMNHHHKFENRYQVTIPYETLQATIRQSAYFITTIPFPEKALQLLDDACVYVKNNQKTDHVVRPTVIDEVLSSKLHVPTVVNDAMKQRLLDVESTLRSVVIGQDTAIAQISSAIQRSFVMLGKRKKPLATFLLLGPTGVGKTETAKALASYFFTSTDSLIRFDMSEFQQVSDIPKLIGDASTGDPGLLISALRQHPYGVLLLDEIEKAAPELLNVFLSLLDEGYITDSTGVKVDCKSLIIIGTSNAGAIDFERVRHADPTQTNESLMQFLIDKHYFSPEFLNRFDGVVAYDSISLDTAVQIGRVMLARICVDMHALHGVTIQVSDQTLRKIITEKYSPAYGARDLARALKESIETQVARQLLAGKLHAGDTVEI
ncbi:MAG: AAA family ATPase [bacterium]